MNRPQVGEIVNGKYRLVRLIGEGGMGSVFEATHEYLGNAVALKFLTPELARRGGLVARFLQEARVSAAIRSPYVVQVSDVDQTPEGLPYLVMELLEGESLHAVITRAGRLPRPTALDFTAQVLNGLEAAHAKGVVHRDLKPDNVYVVTTPQGPLLKLLDFGIAKLRTSEEFQRNLTRPGVLMGTPEYMAPEQAISADMADHRADLYSVGVLLFEMLTGTRPVTGDDPRVMAAAVLAGNVRSLREFDPDAPDALVAILRKALSGRLEERFQSAAEMRAALLPLFTLSMNASGAAGYPSHVQLTPTPAIPVQGAAMRPSDRPPPTVPESELPPVAGGVAPTLPPSEPQQAQTNTGAFRTGTVLGGGPAHGLTSAADFGPTAEMPPMAFEPTSPGPNQVQAAAPVQRYGPPQAGGPGLKKPRSTLSILGIIAGICGALAAVGVIAALVVIQRADDSGDAPPAWTAGSAQPTTTGIEPTVNIPTTTQTVPTSPVPTPTPTVTATTHRPPTSDAGVSDAGDAGAPDSGFPTLPPFPSTFPSAFPSTLPGLPPMPSGLPTFPIPGWPTPP